MWCGVVCGGGGGVGGGCGCVVGVLGVVLVGGVGCAVDGDGRIEF